MTYVLKHRNAREGKEYSLKTEKLGEHPSLSAAKKAAMQHQKAEYPEAKAPKFKEDPKTKAYVAKVNPNEYQYYPDPALYKIRESKDPIYKDQHKNKS